MSMVPNPTDPDGEAVTLDTLGRAHACHCDPAIAQASHAYRSSLLSMLPDDTAEANTGLRGNYAEIFHGGIDPRPIRVQRELVEIPASRAAYHFEGDI